MKRQVVSLAFQEDKRCRASVRRQRSGQRGNVHTKRKQAVNTSQRRTARNRVTPKTPPPFVRECASGEEGVHRAKGQGMTCRRHTGCTSLPAQKRRSQPRSSRTPPVLSSSGIYEKVSREPKSSKGVKNGRKEGRKGVEESTNSPALQLEHACAPDVAKVPTPHTPHACAPSSAYLQNQSQLV